MTFKACKSAVLAVNFAENGGLLIWVLASVVDQTANGLANIGQLVGLCHRLQKLDLFWLPTGFSALSCLSSVSPRACRSNKGSRASGDGS